MSDEPQNRMPENDQTTGHTFVDEVIFTATNEEERAEVQAFRKRLYDFCLNETNKYFNHPNKKTFYMAAAFEFNKGATMACMMATVGMPVSPEHLTPVILGQMTGDVIRGFLEYEKREKAGES